ncbi:MAG: NlpC/P60 family protein [Aggregatilineales bacterium]
MSAVLRQLALVDAQRLEPDFWLARAADADEPLLSPAQIAAFNAHVHQALGLPDPLDLPDALPADEVRALMARAAPQTRPLYGGDGQPVSSERLAELLACLDLPLPAQVPAQFGLVIKRVGARALPAHAILTAEPLAFQTNLLQETVVDVGAPAAVLASSADARWSFCLTPLYWGWLPRDALAVASRDEARAFCRAAAGDFVIATASHGLIGAAFGDGEAVHMGVRLPLLEETPEAWRVWLPAVEKGRLRDAVGTVSRRAGAFQRGWPPPTRRTLLTAAFSLLGEPYAWGGLVAGMFYGRDCSRFVQDVYALTGIALPRNSGQQRQVCATRLDFAPDMPPDERRALIAAQARPGDIVWLPGHVMLYLGAVDGEPHVVHATGGPHMAVVVSTLDLYAGTPSGSLLERVRSVVYPAPPAEER